MIRQRTQTSRVEVETRLWERGQTQTFGAGLYLYKPYSPKEMSGNLPTPRDFFSMTRKRTQSNRVEVEARLLGRGQP